MLRMRDYPDDFKELVDDCARETGVELRRGLRLRNATDGLIALRAGYPTAAIGSVTRLKVPANYHWPTDTAENVDHDSVERRRHALHRDRAARSPRRERVAPSATSAYAAPRPPAALARVGDRVLARRDLAGVGGLLQLGEQRAEPRPARDPERVGQLVAAHERRRRPVLAPRERRADQLARQLEVLRDRLVGSCARASRGGRRPTAA